MSIYYRPRYGSCLMDRSKIGLRLALCRVCSLPNSSQLVFIWAMSLSQKYTTGWSICWVGLTLIWNVPPPCLWPARCSASSANFPSVKAELGRGWNNTNQSRPNQGSLVDGTPCASSSPSMSLNAYPMLLLLPSFRLLYPGGVRASLSGGPITPPHSEAMYGRRRSDALEPIRNNPPLFKSMCYVHKV